MKGPSARGHQKRLATCILVVSLITACSSVPRQRDVELHQQPPITSANPDAQRRFDAAIGTLEAGKYDEAAEAFRLLGAEFSDDAIAPMAELYVARAQMGDIAAAARGPATSRPQADEALRLLVMLMGDRDIDDRIRFAAQAYYSLELALRAQHDEALLALQGYAGPSISPAVLAKDRLAVWPLVAESLYRGGRSVDALAALGRLFEAAQDVAGPADGGEFAPLIDVDRRDSIEPRLLSLLHYARSRGFELAEGLSDVQLQEFLAADAPFLRAAAGWGLLRRQIGAGPAEAQRVAMEDLFNHVASDFVRIDATERAAEISLHLAAIGGPRRLAIGALVPLTGPNRALGNRALAGMLLAQRAFHTTGEPAVTLVIQDSSGDLPAAFEALVGQGVHAIVGPLDASLAAEVSRLATSHKIPVLSMVAENPGAHESASLDDARVYAFRNFINAAAEARAAARLSFDSLQDRRAAVIYPDIGYGRMMAQAFAREFRELGGQVVVELAYDRARSDFVQTAKRVAAAAPDAVYIPDTAAKVGELTAFLANENVWGHEASRRPTPKAKRIFVHYLGTSMWHDPILLRQAASYVNGALFPAWFSPAFSSEESQAFSSRFQAVYARAPDNFEAFAYDSVLRLRALLLDRGINRPDGLRDALANDEPFKGATGSFHFDGHGEPVRKLRFLTVQGTTLVEFPLSVPTTTPARTSAGPIGNAAEGR
ncbi:MAG: penicillin-binding protein activator [Bradymonadaceae bacterium]|nr:penicillin-binding protein activator [Lujinxingiaceae bacterium]